MNQKTYLENDDRANGFYEDVSNEQMRQAEVVCVYFSAHWCPPCNEFTPVLIKFYNDVNRETSEDKVLEVIFVSCDYDEKAFNGYYETMPWIAVKWEDDR